MERVSALDNEFVDRTIRSRGHAKVVCNPMFGIDALAANQIFRFITYSLSGMLGKLGQD